MVTAFQFFVAYLITDTLCMVLTIIIASNVSRDIGSETQMRYFFLVLTGYLIFSLADVTWGFVAYSGLVEVSDVFLSVVNGISLTSISLAAYFWVGFTLARFNSKLIDNRLMRWFTFIPVVLTPVIHVIGFFTNQNVITLPDGTWTYGICHTAITLIQMLYIVVATGIALHKYRHATSRSERRMSLVFVSFMVPFVVAGIVDAFVINTPVATACIMVSLTFVMMSMQESSISTDALTGLNNRRRADVFLEESMTHVSPDRPLRLFIIDLNDFKNVNDTYGHLEGDHALKLTADALRAVCAQVNAFAARWGGDEFVLICTEAADVDPERIARLIHDTLADTLREAHVEYDLTCSVGHAMCNAPLYDYSSLMSQADTMLYDAKSVK